MNLLVSFRTSLRDAWDFADGTEVGSSDSMLVFARSILIDYSFEIQTNVRFEVYRVAAIGEDDLLCVCECYLAQLLAVNGGTSTLDMFVPDEESRPSSQVSRSVPTLEIFAEEMHHSLNSMSFDISIQIFGKQSFWPNSYYLTLSRTKLTSSDETGSVLVYRSESIRRAKPVCDPETKLHSAWLWWTDIRVNTEKLCRGEPWRPIELSVFDKKNRLVGRSLMVAVDFEACSQCFRPSRLFYNLNTPRAHTGRVCLKVNEVVQQYSFLDYVAAGLEICVMVGIDFTRSNGDPRVPDSLHSFIPTTDEKSILYVSGPRNDYALVLRSVLEILQQYDSDKQIPVYGFGAKLPPSHTITSHCFALSGDFFNPEVDGIDGVFRAYQEALGAVTMHGPTRIGEILKLAGQYAEPLVGTAKYCILLLVTDGVIEDFQESVNEIVALANLPLSIVIVGVGDEDFSQMQILDADDHALVSSTGVTMHRDIVQFVPFNQFKDKSYTELAAATLDEIPREVINYFQEKKVYPQLAPVVSDRISRKTRKYSGFAGVRAKVGGFLSFEKKALMQLVTDQGYDPEIVARTINHTGVLCLDQMHLLDVMFHKNKPAQSYGTTHRSIADRLGVFDFLAPQTMEVKKEVKHDGPVCTVCYTNAIDIELRPCTHRVVCRNCFDALPRICPLCRAVVSGFSDI